LTSFEKNYAEPSPKIELKEKSEVPNYNIETDIDSDFEEEEKLINDKNSKIIE